MCLKKILSLLKIQKTSFEERIKKEDIMLPDVFKKKVMILEGVRFDPQGNVINKGYSNVASDAGKATCFGVIEATARRYGYMGKMEDMTLEFATQIYDIFWGNVKGDNIAVMSPLLAFKLFNAGFNIGEPEVCLWFQTAINYTVGSTLTEDGQIGSKTLTIFNTLSAGQLQGVVSAFNTCWKIYYRTLLRISPHYSKLSETDKRLYRTSWYNRISASI